MTPAERSSSTSAGDRPSCTFVYLGVVGTQLRARVGDSPGRAVQPRDDVLHQDVTQLVVRDTYDRLTGEVLRICHDVRDRVHRRDGRVVLLKHLQDLFGRAHTNPLTDQQVELLLVLGATPLSGEPRLGDDVFAPDCPHHPLGDRVRRGGQGEPLPVARLVRIPGSREGTPVAHPRQLQAELVVEKHLGTEDREQRLVDRQVDDLAHSTCRISPPERRHDAERTRERRDAVCQSERREGGRLVSPAVHFGEAREPLRARVPKPGRLK